MQSRTVRTVILMSRVKFSRSMNSFMTIWRSLVDDFIQKSIWGVTSPEVTPQYFLQVFDTYVHDSLILRSIGYLVHFISSKLSEIFANNLKTNVNLKKLLTIYFRSGTYGIIFKMVRLWDPFQRTTPWLFGDADSCSSCCIFSALLIVIKMILVR